MKKYIRTDKNIFEVVGETDLVYRIIGASREKNNVYSRTKKLNDVIAQADAIEKLCDKWVYDDYAGNKNIINDIGFASLETIKRRFEKGIIKNVRLTIWTDKGLIYVAKMNDKGELELLWKV